MTGAPRREGGRAALLRQVRRDPRGVQSSRRPREARLGGAGPAGVEEKLGYGIPSCMINCYS